MADRMTRGLPVHWLTRAKSGAATCAEWKFDRVRKGKSPAAAIEGRMLRGAIVVDGEHVVPSFDFRYEPAAEQRGGTLRLAGPHFAAAKHPSTQAGGYRCGTEYTFVGATGDAVRMLTGGWASNERLVAWHPDDEERWYVSGAACEAAARAAGLAPGQGAKPSPGGFHVDCFDELSE